MKPREQIRILTLNNEKIEQENKWLRKKEKEFWNPKYEQSKQEIKELKKKLRYRYRGKCHAPNCDNKKIGFSKYCPECYIFALDIKEGNVNGV